MLSYNVKFKIAFVLLSIILFSNVSLFSDGLSMPDFPSMPEVSYPTIDGVFYTPTIPSATKTTQTQTISSDVESTLSDSSLDSESSDETVTDDLLETLLGSSTLSATDISNLYDSNVFSSIGSLSDSTSSSYVMLQQILQNLKSLKTEQEKSSAAQKEKSVNLIQDSKTFKTREPSILRFRVNGYNLLDSIKSVFFSELEDDGSFLLSGDRKYYSGQKSYTETFYMLFNASKNSGKAISYNVISSVSQNVENPNSYVYKISQLDNMIAERTGNLVVLSSSSNDLKLDLLLDIDVSGKK